MSEADFRASLGARPLTLRMLLPQADGMTSAASGRVPVPFVFAEGQPVGMQLHWSATERIVLIKDVDIQGQAAKLVSSVACRPPSSPRGSSPCAHTRCEAPDRVRRGSLVVVNWCVSATNVSRGWTKRLSLP